MNLVRVTEPSEEPITLADAKLHLRVDHLDDDLLITSLITAAREYVELVTVRALMTQTWELRLNNWPGSPVELPFPPLASVVSIVYTKEDGTTATVATSVYALDTTGVPGRVFLKPDQSWPSDALYPVNAICIQYTAGWSAAAAVPEMIKAAMKLYLGSLYENREQAVMASGLSAAMLPLGIDALLAPWRVWRF